MNSILNFVQSSFDHWAAVFSSVVRFPSSSDDGIVVDVIVPLFEVVEMSIRSRLEESRIVNDTGVVDRALRRVVRRIEFFRDHSDRVSIGQLVTEKDFFRYLKI